MKAFTLGHYRTENEVLKHPYFGTDAVLKDFQERDSNGYENGYIHIKEFLARELQYDNNQYCIDNYKLTPSEINNQKCIVGYSENSQPLACS